MSSAKDILDEAAMRVGWNQSSMIDVLTDYIDNQQDTDGFADFIFQRVKDDETTFTEDD